MTRVAISPGIFRNSIWRPGRLERYVAERTLWSCAGALGVISALILLINFVEVSRDLSGKTDATALEILGLTLLKSPNIILLLLPFAFLFGVLGAFVGLNRRSELVAMRAAGVSAWRFIFPAAAAAAAIGVITVGALSPIASWMNGQYERLSSNFSQLLLAEGRDTWLRQGDDRNQIVIHARSKLPGGDRLQNVSLFVYTLDEHDRLQFSRLIEAREAVLNRGFWQLYGARDAGPGEKAVTYDTLSIPSNLNPATAFQKFDAPASVDIWALPGVIRRIGAAGFSTTAYWLRFWELLATPFLYAAMSILAAAFSLRLMRLGGLAMLASSGVALGFVIFFFNQLCDALGQADVIPPFLAAWTPPILALLSAFTLLCYTEDG
jgi:lipopolysaccharide export system permease protein